MDNTVKKMKKKKMKSEALAVHVDRRLLGEGQAPCPRGPGRPRKLPPPRGGQSPWPRG